MSETVNILQNKTICCIFKQILFKELIVIILVQIKPDEQRTFIRFSQ